MGSSPFARRYSGNRCFFLFLRLLRCFSSPGCLLVSYGFTHGFLHITAEGFPHSDIRGSTVVCTSPRLFAACHVLLRLLLPRHPPYALCFLTLRDFLLSFFMKRLRFFLLKLQLITLRICFCLCLLIINFLDHLCLIDFRISHCSVFKVLCTSSPEIRGGPGGTRTSDLTLIRRAL